MKPLSIECPHFTRIINQSEPGCGGSSGVKKWSKNGQNFQRDRCKTTADMGESCVKNLEEIADVFYRRSQRDK